MPEPPACTHPILARDLYPLQEGLTLRRICVLCTTAWLDWTAGGTTQSLPNVLRIPGRGVNQLPAGLSRSGSCRPVWGLPGVHA